MSNSYDNFIKELELSSTEPDTTVFADCDIEGFSKFHKEDEKAKVWWVEKLDTVGEFLFSFDRKKIYNLFADYPHNLTEEEVKVFDKENPYWVEFFKDRK
ncbi:DUF7675 family protein [Peptostreptococcus sp. D1]|uniref:DUF7675 family protein n=1 Tax=Peptostreptococcus sp. D1 TaxID=72304 RepID=UPI0008E5063F|nr:hypothetical protein [Peptostreptococcus sp. D1]SFE95722.1 hypothetical protein SAMN02910278_02162 [Peptostreptococcus sp. D1]